MSVSVTLLRKFLETLPDSRPDQMIDLSFREVRSVLTFFDMAIDLMEVQAQAAKICGDDSLFRNLTEVRLSALEVVGILLERIQNKIMEGENEDAVDGRNDDSKRATQN